jgi:hypothetical protein
MFVNFDILLKFQIFLDYLWKEDNNNLLICTFVLVSHFLGKYSHCENWSNQVKMKIK